MKYSIGKNVKYCVNSWMNCEAIYLLVSVSMSILGNESAFNLCNHYIQSMLSILVKTTIIDASGNFFHFVRLFTPNFKCVPK